MQIDFSPMRHDATLCLSRSGDVLTINGAAYDFSPIPEGATLPRAAVACDWLASDVERVDGELRLTLILPHGPDAPRDTLYPARLEQVPDGDIPVPAPSVLTHSEEDAHVQN